MVNSQYVIRHRFFFSSVLFLYVEERDSACFLVYQNIYPLAPPTGNWFVVLQITRNKPKLFTQNFHLFSCFFSFLYPFISR